MTPVLIMYAFLIPETALFILARHAKKGTLSVIIKALCTITVLVTAAAGTALHAEGSTAYMVLIVAGLALGLAGDVVISADFIAGAVLFGLGHICYSAAFLQISVYAQYAAPLLVVLYALFLLVLRKKIFPKNAAPYTRNTVKPPPYVGASPVSRLSDEQFEKLFKASRIPVMVYGFIILSMLSLAATLPFSSLFGGLLMLLGAVLFVISDALMAWKALVRYSNRLDSVSLFCYFIAQSLFAVSVFTLA